MAQSVKLSDTVMHKVRRESLRQSRSVAGQITHWINIGRAIETSPNFDYARVSAALDAAHSPDDLTPEEQDVWFAQFAEDMAEPSQAEQAFYETRAQLGRGVGLSDNGELIYQTRPAAE